MMDGDNTDISMVNYSSVVVPNRLILSFGQTIPKRIWRLAMLILRGWCYLD